MSLYKKNFILNAVFVTVVTVALIAVVALTGRTIVDRDTETRLKDVVNNASDMVARDFFDQEGDFKGVYITYFDSEGKYYGGYKIETENFVNFDGDFGKDFGPFHGGAQPEGAQQGGDQPTSGQEGPPEGAVPDGADGPPDGENPFVPQNSEMFGKRNGATVWRITVDGKSYYACERVAFNSNGDLFFIRGLAPTEASPLHSVLIIFIAATLVVAIAALVISYFSLKKATLPIRQMTDELNRIEQSSDLSKRIAINTKDEEILGLVNAYNDMLERVESILKSQERFTSDVSHELRSPLTVLLAESEFALNDLKTVEEKDKSLEAIYTQTKRLTVMVKQLLDFSRVVGLESVELVDTDISALTTEIVNADQNDKNITVACDVEEGVIVKTDETLFIRMVTNLLDNAVKYGKEGGNVLVTLKKEDAVTLTVKDDGIGMSEETLSHIYERMYQAEKSRSAGGGLGLGLSFVKEISRLLNCDVSVESTLGEGSAFTIKFR